MPQVSPRPIRWSVVVLSALAVALCLCTALGRIRVDSDLAATIPAGSPVLESGRRLLKKHPVVDRIAIDLRLADHGSDPKRLADAAEQIEQRLVASGLFNSVGNGDFGAGIGALHASVADRLPTLFSAQELERLVLPRLTPERIRAAVEQDYAELAELDGVGQARAMGGDPLGLRQLIYARLGALMPKTDVRIEHNQVVSPDGRHLLVSAVPRPTAGDPESSRRLADFLVRLQSELDARAQAEARPAVVMTTAGAYRAAMDNEAIVKRDTNRAVWLVTIAVSLLLLTCFSRPVLGLLTLLPATAGVAISLLLYSLFAQSMSALSLGFGAALISITVDQGIVYIAYLDRVRGASGRTAASETFSSVSLATLTTVGAFLALMFSGYGLLKELGIFAAMGSAFSFIFVHTIFPLAFRSMPPSTRRPLLPIDVWLRRMATGRISTRLVVTLLLLVGLGAFARPRFEVDLNRLNTLTPETRAAEQRIREVWGDLFSRAYVLLEGSSVAELQQRADALSALLAEERAAGRVSSAFSPASLWPGATLAAENLAAWRMFWHPERRELVLGALGRSAEDVGFARDAFAGFTRALESPGLTVAPIPPEAYSLLGVARARDGQGWVWLGAVERGSGYQPDEFARRAKEHGCAVFDGISFGRGLNEFLEGAFVRMLLIVAPFVLAAVGLSFLHPRLVLLVLAPVLLALVCTLGVLGLLGRPIDVPGLMLGVVVLGMGTNFSVYLVRAHQRFPEADHPVHDSVRVAALLDGGATVLGMATMLAAEHAAAQSAGLTGLLGIGFSLLGALFLLPPVLRAAIPIGGPWPRGKGPSVRRLVWLRFRYLEPAPLLRAWVRLRFGRSLVPLTQAVGNAARVLVMGAGHGLEAVWLAAAEPERSLVAMDVDAECVRVLRSALGERGRAEAGSLPELAETEVAPGYEAIVLLEAPGQKLDDWLLAIRQRLARSGRLVMRSSVASTPELTAAMERAGLRVRTEQAAVDAWLVAEIVG